MQQPPHQSNLSGACERSATNVGALSVAPMMAWTDRHCRYLLRRFSRGALLFTEMITTGALLNGPRERLLRFNAEEQPLAIQLGGSEAPAMAAAARMAEDAGFAEININVGCPSPRVKRGSFGACLMKEPALVADMIAAMSDEVALPISVKCRLGVDEHDTQPLLEAFVSACAAAGCRRFFLHARKALLNGLSPAQNRQIPPLDYDRVYQLKQRFPELTIIVNGGICEVDTALAHLNHVDGVMIGRQAYHAPPFINKLAHEMYSEPLVLAEEAMDAYLQYMERELAAGTRLHDMSRHCLGLFAGRSGARRYRRVLSDSRRLKDNDIGLVHEALACIHPDKVAA